MSGAHLEGVENRRLLKPDIPVKRIQKYKVIEPASIQTIITKPDGTVVKTVLKGEEF